jgi:septal ring factor EnvC (AmiA/AmiB activator)
LHAVCADLVQHQEAQIASLKRTADQLAGEAESLQQTRQERQSRLAEARSGVEEMTQSLARLKIQATSIDIQVR